MTARERELGREKWQIRSVCVGGGRVFSFYSSSGRFPRGFGAKGGKRTSGHVGDPWRERWAQMVSSLVRLNPRFDQTWVAPPPGCLWLGAGQVGRRRDSWWFTSDWVCCMWHMDPTPSCLRRLGTNPCSCALLYTFHLWCNRVVLKIGIQQNTRGTLLWVVICEQTCLDLLFLWEIDSRICQLRTVNNSPKLAFCSSRAKAKT